MIVADSTKPNDAYALKTRDGAVYHDLKRYDDSLNDLNKFVGN